MTKVLILAPSPDNKRLAFVGRDNPTTRITVDLNMEGVWKPPKVVGDIPLRSIGNINAAGMSGISGRYGMLELKCNRNVPGWFHRAASETTPDGA